MIYLVEAVLPEGYFADDLRGLSADMAAFRDLLRLRLPRLAQHMDHLQRISDGNPNLSHIILFLAYSCDIVAQRSFINCFQVHRWF